MSNIWIVQAVIKAFELDEIATNLFLFRFFSSRFDERNLAMLFYSKSVCININELKREAIDYAWLDLYMIRDKYKI